MPSSDKGTRYATEYVLGHAEREIDRLTTQARFLEPITRRFFVEAGVGPGMRVLDFGCGAGDTSFLAAELVGSSGAVVGVDPASQAIALARSRAQELGTSNVSFLESGLPELTLDQQFDAVVGRLVLMYVPDPSDTLRQLATFVRKGGVLVFHELDLASQGSYPTAPLYDRCSQWITEFFRRGGADGRMGIKLHQAFVGADLSAPAMRMETILGGDATGMAQIDRMAEACIAWAADFERLGIATMEEIGPDTLGERLREQVIDGGSIAIRCAEIGAWARVE